MSHLTPRTSLVPSSLNNYNLLQCEGDVGRNMFRFPLLDTMRPSRCASKSSCSSPLNLATYSTFVPIYYNDQKLETRSKRAGAKEKRKAADTQKKSSLHRAVSATTGGNLRSPIGGCGTGSNATSQATSSSSSISAANDTRRLPAASRSYERPQPVTAALPSGSSVSQSGSGTPMLPRRRREDGAMEGMQQTRSTVPDVRMRQPEIRAFVRKLRLAGLSERQRRGSSSSAVALHSEPEAHDSSPRSLSKNPLTVYGDVEVLFEELRKITRHGDRNTMDTLLSSEVI